MADSNQKLISIEPFKISIVQIVIAVFTAGVLWGGYQSLTKSVSELTLTMKTVNNTMLVLGTNRDRDKKMIDWLVGKVEGNESKEAEIEKKLERHGADIDLLKKTVFK